MPARVPGSCIADAGAGSAKAANSRIAAKAAQRDELRFVITVLPFDTTVLPFDGGWTSDSTLLLSTYSGIGIESLESPRKSSFLCPRFRRTVRKL